MSRTAVITDSNSGITQSEGKKLGIRVQPMPFMINGKEYFEGVTCGYDDFFRMLAQGDFVSTSQPSPGAILGIWDEALKDNDYVIHIPMSSALSGACDTARALAQDYDGKVFVVDNKRISISQRQSALDALAMIRKGMDPKNIVKELERRALDSSIYLAVNTLELLKRSGRVTSAGAALASILDIKPVLTIQGEKLDAFAKARGMKGAKKVMLKAMKKDLDSRFNGKKYHLDLAYSGDIYEAIEWQQEARSFFEMNDLALYRLPISICCHVGAGVLALGAFEVYE